jgi:hypothetical protein
MAPWTIPQLWPGRTVAVLASGPSMSPEIADQVRAAGIPAIAVNNTRELAPWADLIYACDEAWWAKYPAALALPGLKVTMGAVKGVLRVGNAGSAGYDHKDLQGVHTYGNGGAQAIQIAAKAGASRILLAGFDMHGTHWHGEHHAPLRNSTVASFERWLLLMPQLAAALAERGVEVINCTPGSALTCWPITTMEKALAACPVPAA